MVKQLLRVLLVDDSPGFLALLERFLATEPWLVVVGTAASGQQAIEQVPLLRPDLVLLDLVMPHMNGLEALKRLKALTKPPLVVILSFEKSPELQDAAKTLGAAAMVAKAEMGKLLLPLIATLYPPPTSKGVEEVRCR